MTPNEIISLCAAAGVDHRTCGRVVLERVCGISQKAARDFVKRRDGYLTDQPIKNHGKTLSESHEHTQDQWVISLPKTPIHTLEELVEHCEVDLDVWEVERWVCNKWDVAMAEPATTTMIPNKRGVDVPMWKRGSNKPIVQPLFQIKAWLIRREVKKLSGPDSHIEFIRQLHEILAAEDEFEYTGKPAKLGKPASNVPEIAVVLCSDIHLTETVRPDDANGVNVYNSIIAANRLWEHSQKIKQIIKNHSQYHPIKSIWSPLLGDIINGTIHQEYITTNDLSDTAAVILGARLLRMFYGEMKTLGLPIEVDAVHGNHARLTPKVPTKRQAHTNLDWQLYEMLSDAFDGDDQLRMEITTAQIGMKELFGWNVLFEHGIDVKNGGEEAFEDRVRALFDDPTYREATGYAGASFDQIIIGNMHKPKFLERTVVNGSYIGQNELGQSWRLKPIKAQQLMWGVSPDEVRTWQYNIDLTNVKSSAPDNPFSEYAAWFTAKHGK
jgi:hypothetical protein